MNDVLIPGVLLAFTVSQLAFGVLSYYVSWSSKQANLCALPAGVNVVSGMWCVMISRP